MVEIFTSLLHNYKSKIRNPFIGTLASVWIVRNWVIVYAFFSFDKDCNMSDKINYIQDYFKKKEFWEEFFINVAVAFCVLLISFLLFAISRALTDFYYKICEKWVITKVDKKAILTILEKSKLESEIEFLKKNLDRLRDANSKTENVNSFLVTKYEQMQNEYDNNLLELSEASRKVTENLEVLENKKIPANKVIQYFDDIIGGLSESIKNELSVFIEHDNNITTNHYANYIGLKTELVKLGVLVAVKNEYKKTTFGTLFLEYYKSLNENRSRWN
jgi:hypothetical protein